MFSPNILEKVAKEQIADRLREVEKNYWLDPQQRSYATTFKLSLLVSGVILVAILVGVGG